MMRAFLGVGVLGLLVLLAAPEARAVVEIDHFEAGFFTITADSGTTTNVDDQNGIAQILGGRRRAELEWKAGTGAGLDVSASCVDQTPPPTNHWLDFFADTDQMGWLTLKYGVFNPNPGDGSALGDLTNGGFSTGVGVRFLLADFGATVEMTLTDGSANSFTVTDSTPQVDNGDPPNLLLFKFTDFTGVDPTDIESLMVVIKGVDDGDYRIDALQTNFIPEPATLAGMMLGAAGLARYVRRRRKA